MSETPKIIEDFLKGNNDAGGTIAALEDIAKNLVLQIESLENTKDTAWNAGLEWAASWITGAQMLGRSEEVQEFAKTMAMSIRAAQVGLTKRAADKCPRCHGFCHVSGDGTVVMVCPACNGTGIRR